MDFTAFLRLLPPPSEPVESTGDWTRVEERLGVLFPQDFKDFIGAYGSGTINDFITILNPFSLRPNLNLMSQLERQLDAIRTLVNDFGEDCPYDLYPTPGGLVPAAITDNGDVIHWLTEGSSKEWTIVVNESRSEDYEHFNCSLTSFIGGLISGSATTRAFSNFSDERQPSFRPL